MASTAQSQQRTGTVEAEKRENFTVGRLLLQAVLYIVLTAFAVVAVIPFLSMLFTSVMSNREIIAKTLIPNLITSPSATTWNQAVENYTYALYQANFSQYFWNSAVVSIITIAGTVVFSVLAAYAFARIEFPGKNIVFFGFLATIMIPETVLLIPNFLIVKYLNDWSLMEALGIRWLNNWPSLSIPFWASAFSIFLLRQFFAQIPNDLYEAAQLDGAGHVRFMGQVVLPLSVPPILTVILFTFIQSWNALAWPLLVASGRNPAGEFFGIPWQTWRPITVGLQAFVEEAGANQNLMMAGAVVTMAPIVILYFLFQKQFIENLARTGIKG